MNEVLDVHHTSSKSDTEGPEVEVDYESIPETCVMFWRRNEAPPWIFEMARDAWRDAGGRGDFDGPSKGFIGYIPPSLTSDIPVGAAFPWGRVDRTSDGGYVVQTPEWPVLQFAVGT
jgi:hypothetical protein